MIKIRIGRNQAQDIAVLESEGHAGYALEGHDIVCAGISALLQTALLGLEQHLGAAPHYHLSKGVLHMRLRRQARNKQLWHDSQVLLHSTLLGLQAIAQQYPEHVHIEEFLAPMPN